MGKGKQNLPEKIKPENITGLKEIYKKVYTCRKCGIKYGSDLKKEEKLLLCPICVLKSTKHKK